ncbi:MAG: hypothetical protein WKG07_01125 [Hymenobacter sp.]
MIVRLQSIGPVNEEGMRTVFFTLNGQTRNLEVRDQARGSHDHSQQPKSRQAQPQPDGRAAARPAEQSAGGSPASKCPKTPRCS